MEPCRGDDRRDAFQNVQSLTLKIYITDYQKHGMEKMQAKPPGLAALPRQRVCVFFFLFFFFQNFTLQSTHSIYVTLE